MTVVDISGTLAMTVTDINQAGESSSANFRHRRDRLRRIGRRPGTRRGRASRASGSLVRIPRQPRLPARAHNVHRGALDDLESLREGRSRRPTPSFTPPSCTILRIFAAAAATDARAIEALGEALAGSQPSVSRYVRHRARRSWAPGDRSRRARSGAYSQRGPADPKKRRSRWSARGVCASVGSTSAFRAWRGRSRIRSPPHRHRARKGRLCVCRRRTQPLGGGAPARCRASF